MKTFEEFIKLYPRREAKKAAEKAWMKLNEEETDLAFEGLKKQLFMLKSRERVYIPLPATWLNGARWEDEIEDDNKPSGTFVDEQGEIDYKTLTKEVI
jgi:hypothetical protein